MVVMHGLRLVCYRASLRAVLPRCVFFAQGSVVQSQQSASMVCCSRQSIGWMLYVGLFAWLCAPFSPCLCSPCGRYVAFVPLWLYVTRMKQHPHTTSCLAAAQWCSCLPSRPSLVLFMMPSSKSGGVVCF